MAGRGVGRWLFRLTCTAAAVLVAAVLLAPVMEAWARQAPGQPRWARAVVLFASDDLVRRTSLASAVGLVVTACVFFGAAEDRRG